MYNHMYTHTHVHTSPHMHVCVYIWLCTHVHMYASACLWHVMGRTEGGMFKVPGLPLKRQTPAAAMLVPGRQLKPVDLLPRPGAPAGTAGFAPHCCRAWPRWEQANVRCVQS